MLNAYKNTKHRKITQTDRHKQCDISLSHPSLIGGR